MKIKYYGHSCFTLESNNYVIAIDPYKDVEGRETININANDVYCSHEHEDHNYREGVKIIKQENNPFKITEIHSYHDEVKGAKRGNNIIRIFEAENLRIAHFGDIGCKLEEDQIKELYNLDIAVIPIGGTYTINPKEAKELIEIIKPKTTIPMHYRIGNKGYRIIKTLEDFTSLFNEINYEENPLDIDNIKEGIVVINELQQKRDNIEE